MMIIIMITRNVFKKFLRVLHGGLNSGGKKEQLGGRRKNELGI